MNLSYDAQLLLYLKKKCFNCFLYTQASTSPPPSPHIYNTTVWLENMAINYRNNEK